MAKKKEQLSQEEVWDDRVLVDTWNAALKEYQLYHSIHARGERVEDVLREAEKSQDLTPNYCLEDDISAPNQSNGFQLGDQDKELEDGEVGEEVHTEPGAEEQDDAAPGGSPSYEQRQQRISVTTSHVEPEQSFSGMPQAVLNGVHDDALKNLMMSWYYAGYYTGLYDGQKQPSTNTRSAVDEKKGST